MDASLEKILELVVAYGEACCNKGYFSDPDSAEYLKHHGEAERLLGEIEDRLGDVYGDRRGGEE